MAPENPNPRRDDDLIDWFTISYRNIYIVVGILALIGGVAWYLLRTPPAAQPQEKPAASSKTARFTHIEGNVKVKPVGSFEWLNADRSMQLRKNDLVRTSAGSSAEVSFFDGTVVRVRPDSLITIEESFEDPATKRRKVAWRISSGEVNFETGRRNVSSSSTEVSTPTVRVMQGELAAGDIRVAETGDSSVRQYRGSGRVETNAGDQIELASNEALSVDASGTAAPKVVLPATPELEAPPHEAEISYPDPTKATTLLTWKPVSDARSYRILLDYSPYFNRPVVDRGGIRDSSVELRGLEAGSYYWKVAALNADRVEGAYSAFARFVVTRDERAAAARTGTTPPLRIQTFDIRANILQIKGNTAVGATMTVNGQRIDVQPNGSFNEFVTIEGLGKQMVVMRATGVDGGVKEIKRSVVVAY